MTYAPSHVLTKPSSLSPYAPLACPSPAPSAPSLTPHDPPGGPPPQLDEQTAVSGPQQRQPGSCPAARVGWGGVGRLGLPACYCCLLSATARLQPTLLLLYIVLFLDLFQGSKLKVLRHQHQRVGGLSSSCRLMKQCWVRGDGGCCWRFCWRRWLSSSYMQSAW